MIIKDYVGRLASALFIIGLSAASVAAGPDALFADNSLLELRISGPFDQIMRERPDEQDVAGNLQFTAVDGSVVELDVGIRTRGDFRRRKEICVFAPLRINFRKSQLKDTIFAGQDKLKLVTHCDKGSGTYQQTLLKEFIAYRILNVMTDISFRVRLLRITYVATDDADAEKVSYAFFIEDDERLAERVGLQQRKVPAINLADLQPEYTSLTSVFQYFIGNLDFSPIRGADDDDCCHNHALFSDEHGVHWSVPYDFDLSGLAHALHAVADATLGQLNIRQRIYRGRCAHAALLPDTLQQFRERRAAIEALIAAQAELSNGSRRSLNAYVKSFYKKIDAQRTLEQFAKVCI